LLLQEIQEQRLKKQRQQARKPVKEGKERMVQVVM